MIKRLSGCAAAAGGETKMKALLALFASLAAIGTVLSFVVHLAVVAFIVSFPEHQTVAPNRDHARIR
jgi:hypothetical protein